MTNVSYSAKKSAVKAAKRQGLANYSISEVDGRFVIVSLDNATGPTDEGNGFDDSMKEAPVNVIEAEGTTLTQEAIDVIEATPVASAPKETKKGAVHALLTQFELQIPQIAEKLGIGNTAARSLIGDLQRAGVVFKVVRKAGERLGYYSVA